MDVSRSESTEAKYMAGKLRRGKEKGKCGLLEMVSGRGKKESERTENREKKAWLAGTTCTYTGVRRGWNREGEGEESKVRCRREYARNHRDSIESAGALVRISNTERIQGIFPRLCRHGQCLCPIPE